MYLCTRKTIASRAQMIAAACRNNKKKKLSASYAFSPIFKPKGLSYLCAKAKDCADVSVSYALRKSVTS